MTKFLFLIFKIMVLTTPSLTHGSNNAGEELIERNLPQQGRFHVRVIPSVAPTHLPTILPLSPWFLGLEANGKTEDTPQPPPRPITPFEPNRMSLSVAPTFPSRVQDSSLSAPTPHPNEDDWQEELIQKIKRLHP